MPSVLIVGATRGLGRALVTHYSSNPTTGTPWTVYATTRSSEPPKDSWATKQNIYWLLNVDLEQGPEVAKKLAQQVEVKSDVYHDGTAGKLNSVIITAGYFATEEFGQSKWEEEVKMYTLSSVAPVFVVEALDKSGLFVQREEKEEGEGKGGKSGWTGTKIILVSSESGSITLRHEQEGGGNFAHHGSKSALNMVGKQLSFDLKPRGVAVGIVHPRYVLSEFSFLLLCVYVSNLLLLISFSPPISSHKTNDSTPPTTHVVRITCTNLPCSFVRTEMTANIGFDKFWDDGGALPPDEAAKILADWVEGDFDISKTGTYWAPRGTKDIGNWEVVMGGDEIKGAVQLPW